MSQISTREARGTGVYIYDSSGRLLLLQRSSNKKFPMQWEPPGGKVEDGESFETAALREVKEEVGLDVQLDPKTRNRKTTNSDESTWEVQIYRGLCPDVHKAKICEPEAHCGIGWFTASEIPRLNLTQTVRTEIDELPWN